MDISRKVGYHLYLYFISINIVFNWAHKIVIFDTKVMIIIYVLIMFDKFISDITRRSLLNRLASIIEIITITKSLVIILIFL